MCLSETYSEVLTVKHLFDAFRLKQEDALSRLIFSFALEYIVRKVQVKQERLEVNGTHEIVV